MSEGIKRALVFAYGATAYLIVIATLLYAIGFVGNVIVPKSIDVGSAVPLTEALLVNGLLLCVFAVQHSVMARKSFKRWLTRRVPESMERSTYVLFSSIALILLYWQWRPMTVAIWHVESPAGRAALYGLCASGWLIVVLASFMINHFDLFGLRQVWLRIQGKAYTDIGFCTPGLYRIVRHPIQLGFLIAFWAKPDMTAGHLLFAAASTGYILVALKRFEEPDLIAEFGETYEAYRQRVAFLIPGTKTRR